MAAPDPVDWALATRIARRVAGRDRFVESYLGASLAADFDSVTEEAEARVAEHTGLRAPGSARAAVLDRSGWVEANVRSMRRLLAPFTERVAIRVARSPFAPVGRVVAGGELGVLLGLLAQRVLGQYDLLVPDPNDPDGPADSAGAGSEGGAGDAVYFVGANVLALEKRFAFRPRDFRLWIALHEVTHRAQFTGVPWLRPYFLSLVEQSLSTIDPDPRRLVDALGRAADELRRGRNPLDDGGLVGLLATDEQRGALARVQALMSLLEGHGNAVMNTLGAELVDGQDRMARVLTARRRQGGVGGVVWKLLGFEMKFRQYELGERFVAAVERAAGPRAIDAAWASADALPNLAELHEPERWLDRVDGRRPAATAPTPPG